MDYDGTADQLCFARKSGDELADIMAIGKPGVIHDPAITVDREGNPWCFWGQLNEKGIIELRGCSIDSSKKPDQTPVAPRFVQPQARRAA